jgi:hypothetical protein
MKKKQFLTEADRKQILADKEKSILESFASTFNKIKRLDEAEITPNDVSKKFIVYPNFQGVDPSSIMGQNKVINVADSLGNEPKKDYKYFTTGKLPDGTEVKQYVDNMVQNAQNGGWKSFDPVVAIEHPLLSGKYAVIDGNHRLGAFKMGKLPQIKATILNYDDILLATPETKWQDGKTPETISLNDAKNKGIDLKQYFTIKDLKIS